MRIYIFQNIGFTFRIAVSNFSLPQTETRWLLVPSIEQHPWVLRWKHLCEEPFLNHVVVVEDVVNNKPSGEFRSTFFKTEECSAQFHRLCQQNTIRAREPL